MEHALIVVARTLAHDPRDLQDRSDARLGIVILLFGAIVLLRRPINNYLQLDLKRAAASANVYYSLLFFVFLLISDVTRSIQFMNYLDDFRKEVRSHTGLIPLEATNLPSHGDDIFGWYWPHATLSILLRDNARQAVILNSSQWHSFEPFDPKGSIPDLSSYYRTVDLSMIGTVTQCRRPSPSHHQTCTGIAGLRGTQSSPTAETDATAFFRRTHRG
jgi:hypothetical protein